MVIAMMITMTTTTTTMMNDNDGGTYDNAVAVKEELEKILAFCKYFHAFL